MVALRIRFSFFFNDTATTEIYTLSLHDALPIYSELEPARTVGARTRVLHAELVTPARHDVPQRFRGRCGVARAWCAAFRSEEHTSELQSRQYLVCRLLLEKKKKLYYTLRVSSGT